MSYYSVQITDSATQAPVFFGYFLVGAGGIITDFWQSSATTALVSPYTYCLLPMNDPAFPDADNFFDTGTRRLTIKGVNIQSSTIREYYGLDHSDANLSLFGAYYTLYYQGTNFASVECLFTPISNPQPPSMTTTPSARGPLYTDNSLVFYKPSSLASGGVCTVSNSRHKARKT